MPQLLGFVGVSAVPSALHASGIRNVADISPGVYHITFAASVANACKVASLGLYETVGRINVDEANTLV